MISNATLFALCTRQPGNELIAAECRILTGGMPAADGVAVCDTLEHIPRAAYVKTGLRLIARAPTLPDLVEAVRQMTFDADNFAIEVLALSNRFDLHTRECKIALADAICADPDLDHPQHRFLLVIRQDGLYLGEIVTEADPTYLQHDRKPRRTSASLPSRIARAMINLVGPSARSVVNLCCGSGSLLLEACAVGLEVWGVDWNWKMVEMSRQNVAHFGYQAVVERGDARLFDRPADAIVADLPYGHRLVFSQEIVRDILANAARLAPVGVFAAGAEISPLLHEAGYSDVQVYRVSKHAGLTRWVHRAARP